MMITVANPIYDTVFKYLMEDERVAKTLLSALLSAASDANLRQDMNVEDEYFSAIENRDTAIMQRDQRIAEQDAQIAEQELLLNKTIQMLMSAGLNIETIAMNMNIKRDEVLRIAKLS